MPQSGHYHREGPPPSSSILMELSLQRSYFYDSIHTLGLVLDPELPLESQVTAVARSAFLQLRLVYQLCPYLDEHCLATVTHALVTSRMDYCNALYLGLPLKMVRILNLVQNRAARILTGTGKCSHIMPVLYHLHWLPIELQAQFKVPAMTYKALNSLGPRYLKERLLSHVPSHPLRSEAEALLQEPSLEEIKRVSTRRRAFSVVVPRLWNTLPGEVCLAPALLSFCHQAKIFLFFQHFIFGLYFNIGCWATVIFISIFGINSLKTIPSKYGTVINNKTFQLQRKAADGRGKCPFEPTGSYASLMFEGSLYSATSNNFLGTEPIILRSLKNPLRTEFKASWLNEPTFIHMDLVQDSDTSADKIYVFFTETAVEFEFYDKLLVSRVAQICTVRIQVPEAPVGEQLSNVVCVDAGAPRHSSGLLLVGPDPPAQGEKPRCLPCSWDCCRNSVLLVRKRMDAEGALVGRGSGHLFVCLFIAFVCCPIAKGCLGGSQHHIKAQIKISNNDDQNLKT
ncbi:Semaphorin-4D [Varanus komodoensis]|nr:Semaphorin-4D [Varanus komodoensis]